MPIILVVGAVAMVQARDWIRRRHEDRDYELAKQRLAEGKKTEAGFIVSLRLNPAASGRGGRDERVARWYRLDIECSLKTGNIARLSQLYERVPDLILANEDASARVAMAMLVFKEFDKYHELREQWRGREQTPSWWLAVDVEAAQRQGHRDEALHLLETRTLAGREDSARLLRLAMLHGENDPSAALRYLDQAFVADPKNADVRTVRAMQCEQAGDLERARMEYVAAEMAEPDNLARVDAVAEFFRRRGDFARMVKTLEAAQRPLGSEQLRLKLDFWAKVAYPSDAKRVETDAAELRDLIGFIERLPAGAFWDDKAFLALPSADVLARRQQETWWLHVLQLIKDHREADAYDLVTVNPFRERAFSSDLDSALNQTLRLRLRGERVGATHRGEEPGRHPLLAALDRMGRGQGTEVDQVEPVLRGKYAFAALALSVGWNEAALTLLPDLGPLPADSPSWLAYGVTQALRWNRGFDQALAYARAQTQSPDLIIAEGEMLIALKRRDEAAALLDPLRADEKAGTLASWMLASMALEDRDADRADAIIAAAPQLAGHLRGQELTARAMVVRDRNEDADRLYLPIGEQSPEAALWLTRRARQRGDGEAAEKWTRTLVRLQPGLLENADGADAPK